MFGPDGRFDADAMERGIERVLARQNRVLILLNTPFKNVACT